MGETYPDDFLFYNGEKLGYTAIIGGDNIYQFYSLPYWVQDYKKILTQIAIAEADYKTVANGNISSGILNINVFTKCFLLNYSKHKTKNKPKNTEYLTFKDICVHKPEYDNKIHRLLTETIWKEIAVSPPNITKDKKLNDTYSATWEVRIPLGYKHEAKNIYKSCCKYIEVKK